MIARARSLRPRLRELQEHHTALGTYSQEIHEAFAKLRLYDILRPKRYGGLELGLETFFRVVTEIARADPGVGWSFELGASHAYQFSSFFPERAQEEAFRSAPFVSASRTFALKSEVERVEGGWRVSGRWDYASGCTWSTHFMPTGTFIDEDGTRTELMFIVPRSDFEIQDDWGGDATIGMSASSSNSIEIHDAFVPEYNAVVYNFKDYEWGTDGTPGYRLHGNPMYLGRTLTFFIAGLVVTQTGAALAALDEYERLLERNSSFPPRVPRVESPEYQMWYGQIMSAAEAATELHLASVRSLEQRYAAWAAGGPEVTVEDDARLRGQVLQAGKLAEQAVSIAFSTAGTSSAGKAGARLGKYYRDCAMYRTHIGSQYDMLFASQARVALGQPLTM
ncbi:hydroxylase [Pseudoclavibacter endophyticus]|uniref:Hydroxylase n=2 Tax=Pseudoclavibacter endophyticus TaxID=1778590 RepID=A0A6H9WQP3_9MICO|nr:hydroxylase [Pseudoclavibacter endophyticus]